MEYLVFAYEERARERGPRYSIYDDRGSFATVWRDTAGEYLSWPEQVIPLVDQRNWNLLALRVSGGDLRRPKAYLSVHVTDKGNLALEWYPTSPGSFTRSRGDWLEWDNEWPIGGASLPMSRILFIHDFSTCFRQIEGRSFSKAEYYLAQAVRHLLDAVYRFLRGVIDIEVTHDLYLEYSDAEAYAERHFLGVAIRDVAEYERERVAVRKQQWLRATFEEELGISAKDLLTAFEATGKYAPTAKALAPRLKQGARLSGDKVKRLIARLRAEYPELTEPEKPADPPGTRSADVVELRPKKS